MLIPHIPFFPFLLVKDLEKRKDPTKPKVKVVDKGNGSKPTSPEGQIRAYLTLGVAG